MPAIGDTPQIIPSRAGVTASSLLLANLALIAFRERQAAAQEVHCRQFVLCLFGKCWPQRVNWHYSIQIHWLTDEIL